MVFQSIVDQVISISLYGKGPRLTTAAGRLLKMEVKGHAVTKPGDPANPLPVLDGKLGLGYLRLEHSSHFGLQGLAVG